jgi:hypothetical protein
MELSEVSEKVEFSRHLLGAEIIEITRQIIDNKRSDPSHPMFYIEQKDKVGFAFSIGQTSRYPYQHLLLMPRMNADWLHLNYFRVSTSYTSIQVISRPLPDSLVHPRKLSTVAFVEAEIKKAVCDFAKKFREHPWVR